MYRALRPRPRSADLERSLCALRLRDHAAKQYVGYDSAGQHVAAASGTPLISIFAGYPSERMFQRWRPYRTRPDRHHKGRRSRSRERSWGRTSVPDFVIALANGGPERSAHDVHAGRYGTSTFTRAPLFGTPRLDNT